jgi:3-phosphoinositide dependent protein kinase-1
MRLGCDNLGGYSKMKEHRFFKDTDWENIYHQTPPSLLPYLPSTVGGEEGLRSDYNMPNSTSEQDLFEERFLQCFGLGEGQEASNVSVTSEREKKLKDQSKTSPW